MQLILDGEIDLVVNTPHGVDRRRLGPRRRLRDPHRGDHGQHPVHHHRPGPRRRGPGHRGAPRAATSACARCRTGPASAPVTRPLTDRRCSTRSYPDRPREGAPRRLPRRSGPPRPVARAASLARARGGRRSQAMGLDFPGALGLAAGLRQERRRHRRARRPRVRLRRDRHRHRGAAARQPQAAAVPAARRPGRGQPDGLQQRRRRGGRPTARGAPASTAPADRGRASLGRQHRQDQGGARGREAVARLREEHPPARAVRRLPGRQRLLAEHPGPARPAGRRPARAAAARRTAPRPTT